MSVSRKNYPKNKQKNAFLLLGIRLKMTMMIAICILGQLSKSRTWFSEPKVVGQK